MVMNIYENGILIKQIDMEHQFSHENIDAKKSRKLIEEYRDRYDLNRSRFLL